MTDDKVFHSKPTPEWIQTDEIYPHERFGMEVRIENVGPSSITVPIHPNLTYLQPKDAATREYYSLRLALETKVPGSGLLVGWLWLYGSSSKPDTLLILKPGGSIRVNRDRRATLI